NNSIKESQSNAVNESNQYTDQKTQQLNNNIKESQSNAVSESNQYTDQKTQKLNNNIKESQSNAITESHHYTNQKTDQLNTSIKSAQSKAISDSRNYTNQRVDMLEQNMNGRLNSLDNKMDKNADRANAGIASVSAMANIPYTNNTNFSMGIGLGNYRNGNAAAFGGQYNVNDNVNIRSSISWNNEDSAVYGAGIAVGF
ncbi:TPA: YadA C-terminal domain-containing protein, partial [Providencia alcalifaciens]